MLNSEMWGQQALRVRGTRPSMCQNRLESSWVPQAARPGRLHLTGAAPLLLPLPTLGTLKLITTFRRDAAGDIHEGLEATVKTEAGLYVSIVNIAELEAQGLPPGWDMDATVAVTGSRCACRGWMPAFA